MLPLDPFGLMLLQMQTFPNQHFSDLVIEFQSTIVASAISKLLPKQKKHVKTKKHYEVLHPSIAEKKVIDRQSPESDFHLTLSSHYPRCHLSCQCLGPIVTIDMDFVYPPFETSSKGYLEVWDMFVSWRVHIFLCFIVYISGTPGLSMLYTVSS